MEKETEIKIDNIQYYSTQSFEKDMKDDQMNSKLITLFETEISDIFQNILCISKNEFISFIESKIKSSLIEQYPNDDINTIFKNQKFNQIFNKNMKILNEKYSLYMKELTESWENYNKSVLSTKIINKDELFFSSFRKHCIKTGKYALHKCSKHKYGEYLSVLHKSSTDGSLSIRYLICTKCKKAYFTSLFLNYCLECDTIYYSNKLINNEPSEFQLATFDPPHCKSLFNKKIRCPKCLVNYLYLNIITNKLQCLNQKCNFICEANNSNWKCDICNINFTTNIKIFNPLEIQNVKDAIKLTLLIKKKAHPIRMICCNEINVYNSIFYHNKNCKGILYLGELDKNSIIICQKFKAINYFNNFIWTCPSCGKRFKENPENYKFSKNNKREIKANNMRNTEPFENFSKTNELKIDTYKLIKSNPNFISKNTESTSEKIENRNSLIQKRINFENGRNENILYGQKTSNSNNRKKKYILSKFLEMQININNNSKSNKDETTNSSSNKNISNNDNNKSNNSDCIFKNRNNYKNRFCIRNVLNQNKINDMSTKENNKLNLNLNKSKEKKEIIKSNRNSNFRNSVINTNNKIVKINNHKRFYLNKYSKSNIDGEKTIENNKYVKSELNIKNRNKDDNNNSKNNIQPKRELRKYISSDIDENTKNLIYYKSQNLFNVRQKYKKNNKKNSNNIYSNNIDENKIEKKDNIENEKSQRGHKRIFNILNNSSKEKNLILENIEKISKNEKKRNESAEKVKKIEKIENKKNEKSINEVLLNRFSKSRLKKLEIKDSNLSNNDLINVDSNNERSKESTTECNKSTKKSDNYYVKEYNNKDKDDKYINNEDNDINILEKQKDKEINEKEMKEKEKKEKEEMLKEILLNVEKEEQHKKRPDDIIDVSNVLNNSNFSIPILTKSFSDDEKLYNQIQNKIKDILSKGKLPLFDIKNYIIRKQIGDGSYGFIYQVIQKYTREEYAIKKIIASDIQTLQEFQNEFEIVHQNPHPFILDLYGICINAIDADNFILYVLMDLADCDWEMEINEYLINNKYYTEEQLISILKQLTSALSFLEKEKNIAHRDIKPENILVFRANASNKEDIYKIADFGEAKEAKVSKQLNTLRGTELYMSPLLYSGLKDKVDDVKHDPYKSDVFSLGYCLIYAAAMNFNIIYDIRNLENKFMIKRVLKKYFNKRYSDKFIELVLNMITFDETQRLDFIELKEILEKYF